MAHALATVAAPDLDWMDDMPGRPNETLWVRRGEEAWRRGLPHALATGALAAVARVLAEATGDPRPDVLVPLGALDTDRGAFRGRRVAIRGA